MSVAEATRTTAQDLHPSPRQPEQVEQVAFMQPRLNVPLPGPVATHGAARADNVAFPDVRVIPPRKVPPDAVAQTAAVLEPMVDEGRPLGPVAPPAAPAMADPVVEVDPSAAEPPVRPVVVITTAVRITLEAVVTAR